MQIKYYLFILLCFLFSYSATAQENVEAKPTYKGTVSSVEYVTSLASRPDDLTPADVSEREAEDKKSLANKIIISEDPQKEDDYFVRNRHPLEQSRSSVPPSIVFDAYASNSQPTDPSLAIGPNHVMVVFNTGFAIYDKSGNQLLGQTSPNPAIFPSGGCCDLTASYDNAADRWVLSFLGSGAQVAVSDGPDPINNGWFVYTISAINDYQKLSVWSDGYYLTDNTSSTNKVWAMERDAMLTGNPNAQILGFNLPGITTSGFYSPQAFNVSNGALPAAGGAPIVYLQDNAWGGVSSDHVKLWTIDVDWNTPGNSTISAAQEIPTTPFISVFDGGSFSNLTQPNGGSAIDALQATVMNQAHFRKFTSHNSAVFNFVVDADAGSGELAAVRWIELRQSGDNQPWSLYQEGTYTAPDGRHAWNASLAMDGQGNIGMGYTSMSGPSTPSTVRVSSYFTGRASGDPLGTMTLTEEVIANGNANFSGTRYGDYSKIDVDPSDDQTFWFINEYMNSGRKGVVGAFQVQAGPPDTEAPTNPTNLVASNITASGATLNWTASTDNVGVTLYNVFIDGTQVGTSNNTTFNVTGLSPLTTYTASVNAQDAAGNTSGSATTSFTTLDAPPATYCNSASTNVNDEYIGRVQLNTIDNTSGAQFYSDFTAISTNLSEGQAYTVTVTPTWTGTIYAEGYAVWIDYNSDQDFDDAGELVWSKAPSTDTPNSGTFTVPTGTAGSATRMRVSMKYNGIPTSCETFTYGEVEDYTVILGAGGDTQAPSTPTNLTANNITQTGATLNWNASTDNVGVTQYNVFIDGTQVGTSANTTFNVTGLSPSTTYTASVNAEDAAGNISGNATTTFTTLDVPPASYCNSASTNVNDEYIGRVQLNTIDNTSGAQFYSDFTSISTDLNEGQSYTVTVTPTWTGTVYAEGYAVWIDYNSDQDFDDAGELVWSKAPSTDTPNSGTFTVPNGTSGVATRMRVSMKYNGVPTSCETFTYGEVEDYTVILGTGGGGSGPGEIAGYYFETGFDGWSDGGSDCARLNRPTQSYEGNYSIRLRDNTGSSNSVSPVLDLSSNTVVTIEFHVYPRSMETGEDFFVEFFNGSSYQVIGNYVSGTDFTNNSFLNEVITLSSSTYSFNANNRIRFRCDASANNDHIYFDQVIVSGDNVSNAPNGGPVVKEQDNGEILKSFTQNANDKINIYPNPTKSIINIEIDEIGFDEFMIFSSTGQIMYQQEGVSDQMRIDVSQYATGMYFVRFVSDGLAVTKRFVKD